MHSDTPSRLTNAPFARRKQWILVSVVCVAFGLHLWGIRRNLPFTQEMDEPVFVARAVRIAATGDLNPHWFGNPGSTIIYPLAALYRMWYVLVHRGPLFGPAANLQVLFDSKPSAFYLSGRFLAIAYSVASIPLVYRIGRRAFGERIALMGAWLSTLPQIAVAYAQMVRTDSAGTFFGLLALWLCLRLYARPTAKNHVIAGLAIGLGIATRYFLAILVFVLLLIEGLLGRQASRHGKFTVNWRGIGAGLFAVAVAFALATPYFFPSFSTALADLRFEARSTQLGADGLSPVENLAWYLVDAIPRSITWPQAVLAVIGISVALWKRAPRQTLLLVFVVMFLAATSLSPLHWQRWVIPILPVLVLFVACALDTVSVYISTRLRLRSEAQWRVAISVLLLVSVWPLYQLVLSDITQANPTTRILAREWILQNLTPGSRIAQESFTAPLAGTGFVVSEQASLAEGRTLSDYRRAGYRYLVVSSYRYEKYLAEPNRYPSQVAFYRALFSEERLLQQFEPSLVRGGAVIRIYELRGP